jgi:hypothetical protein
MACIGQQGAWISPIYVGVAVADAGKPIELVESAS